MFFALLFKRQHLLRQLPIGLRDLASGRIGKDALSLGAGFCRPHRARNLCSKDVDFPAVLHLNKGSIATMCRRYREQGLEEYARNKYQSHRWLLNWEREEEILNQFNDGTGKQVTANEIKTVLDEACGKDTGRVYVYNVLKRHGWSKKMPRSRHPKAADEEACEASKKLNPVCWMPNPKTRPKLSD